LKSRRRLSGRAFRGRLTQCSPMETSLSTLDQLPFGAQLNKGLTVKTGQTHVAKYHRTSLKKIEDGELDPSFVITHRPKLEEAPSSTRRFATRRMAAFRSSLFRDARPMIQGDHREPGERWTKSGVTGSLSAHLAIRCEPEPSARLRSAAGRNARGFFEWHGNCLIRQFVNLLEEFTGRSYHATPRRLV